MVIVPPIHPSGKASMAHAQAGLRRLLGKRVFLQGRFDRGVKERLVARAEAQQATLADKFDSKTDYLVLADVAGGKTAQAKAASFNAKGASVQVMDADSF